MSDTPKKGWKFKKPDRAFWRELLGFVVVKLIKRDPPPSNEPPKE